MKGKLIDQSYDKSFTPGFDGKVLSAIGDSGAVYTPAFKDWMLRTQDYRCGYCGDFLGSDWRNNKHVSVEHIKNRRLGGSDMPPNIMFSCVYCNSQKNYKHYLRLKIAIQMRRFGITGVISQMQALKLMLKGVLTFDLLSSFHFEDMNWPHVQKNEESYYDEGEETKIIREMLEKEARTLRAKSQEVN